MDTGKEHRVYIRCERFSSAEGESLIKELEDLEGVEGITLQLTESVAVTHFAFWLIPAAKFIAQTTAGVALKEAITTTIKRWLAEEKLPDDATVKIYDEHGQVITTVRRRDVRKHPPK